jgi:hypothetical protein
MIRATIWREVHNPQARSGGSTALIWRSVSPLTFAAPRERNEPRMGMSGSLALGVAGIRTSVGRTVRRVHHQW